MKDAIKGKEEEVDIWLAEYERYDNSVHHVNVQPIGLYVFEIIRWGNSTIQRPPTNEKVLERLEADNRTIESYKMRKVRVLMVYCHRPINQSYCWVKMSEKVWYKIVELSKRLRMSRYDTRGKKMLYWKKDSTTVWFVFLREDQWLQLETLVREFDTFSERGVKELKMLLPWSGNKTGFNLKRFKEFYEV